MQYTISITIDKFTDISQLEPSQQNLVNSAIKATQLAYSPYSKFKVGAAALLSDDIIVLGSNQENASFGVTLCAERTLLSNITINYPGKLIIAIALSYDSSNHLHNHGPISPCGICRQSLLELEENNSQPIKLIMHGLNGEIYVVDSIRSLVPLAFSEQNMR